MDMSVINWWPLLLPAAALSGWLIARGRYRQNNQNGLENNSAFSKEYFVGLNYLLNEQPDKAVDVFIKLLEVDNNTVETHLALGSLFRRRGEVDRAIRIHQNLIARPQLSRSQRLEALMALGRDYMSAGFLDRAEKVFQDIVAMRGEHLQASLQCLLDIYQQEKSWSKAIEIAQKLELVSRKQMKQVIAHHYCELVEEVKQHNVSQAQNYLKQAFAADKNSIRASLLLAELEIEKNQYKAAIKAYKQIKYQDPAFISEVIPSMLICYDRMADEEGCLKFLSETLIEYPKIPIVIALAERIKKHQGLEKAIDFFAEQLSYHPSIRGLNKLIAWHLDSAQGKVKAKLEMLQEITSRLVANKPIYRCGHCGFSGKTLHWLCPSCKQWSTTKPIHGLEGV